MSSVTTTKIPSLKTSISVPGDKSISHRAIILASISNGRTVIRNFLTAEDCLNTLKAFEKMGIKTDKAKDGSLVVNGAGLFGLKKPDSEIYLGNSGTSMRLLPGILAGQPFETILIGDESLSKRPMKRITQPLRIMGASIEGRDDANFAPLKIKGAQLKPIVYNVPVASAQVKSCLMLAALYADGASVITEPQQSRDHTERIFKLFKAKVLLKSKTEVSVAGGQQLISPGELNVPSDISSAAFFIALGMLLPKTEITIISCGINPTRMGFVDAARKMGADITIKNIKQEDYEPAADIVVKSSKLKSIIVQPGQIPSMIDEIPILTLLAVFAQGETIVKGLNELRVKETDRINSMVTNLRAIGADVSSQADAIIIKGPLKNIKQAKVTSFGDHRTAMAMIIAGCLSDKPITVEDTDCINTSFPGFMDIINGFKIL
ncbi:MAG: 3-phosphoshikimate 1-carboxyvinyltransferase [Candidatus Omnitrophica bacterium]|nr:3-phosphoshikimate 1-carboxyvinyltransferase [Candidatus Omnitrophota bacterium]